MITTTYLKVSEIEPEGIRYFMIDRLHDELKDINYPGFEKWFYNTVLPEIKDGRRDIILSLSKLDNGRTVLSGIAIVKNHDTEKKICTFKINENYRGLGVGKGLFETCFEYLGTRSPVFTVSHNKKDMFSKLLDMFSFKETQCLKDYYISGLDEYVYNGKLNKRDSY